MNQRNESKAKPAKPPVPEGAKIIWKALTMELMKLKHVFPKLNLVSRPVSFKEISSEGPVAEVVFKTQRPEWTLSLSIDGQKVKMNVDCKNNVQSKRDPEVKMLRGSLTRTYSGNFGDVLKKFIADIRKIA